MHWADHTATPRRRITQPIASVVLRLRNRIIYMSDSLTSFSTGLKCHFFNVAYPDHPVYMHILLLSLIFVRCFPFTSLIIHWHSIWFTGVYYFFFEREQSIWCQNMPRWHVGYFELKAINAQQTQEKKTQKKTLSSKKNLEKRTGSESELLSQITFMWVTYLCGRIDI